MKKLLISVGILASISTFVSLIFWDKTAFSFVKWFCLITVIQFIIHYLKDQYLNTKYGVEVTKLESKLVEEYNKNIQQLICPCYFKHSQEVFIKLNEENKYACEKCDKKISAVVDIQTAMATIPVDSIKATGEIKPTTNSTNE